MNSLFKPKFYTILKSGISREQISKDILSGVVVGVVALPLAIAFAVASGVSPEKGLITAVIAGFIISFLGGSRVQIGGPTGAFIIIVYGIINQYGIDGLIISTILAGVILIVMGLMKLGSLLKFFPQPLITGFTSGIALVIFSTQLKDGLGLNIEKVPSGFIERWSVYLSNLDSTNIYALAITILTILISIYFKKISKLVPGSFVAIILSTIIVKIFNLPVSTIESFFGDIPSEISFVVPNFDLSKLHHYISPAITIALLGGIESLLSAVVSDGMIGGKHRSNTELIAQGVANIVTPFFGGIPATGAIARTATNVKNGGRTPIAGMVHAVVLLLIMLFLGGLAKLIPMSSLAGVLIVISYNMSEWRSFVAILKSSTSDIIILLSTFFLTVLVDLTVAIEVGVLLSALLFMKRMSDLADKQLDRFIDTDIIDDYSKIDKKISIYEISGPLFFGSARRYSELIEEIGLQSKILIIRMRHLSFVDQTGTHNLKDTINNLHKSGILVIFSGINKNVEKDFRKSGIISMVGEKNIFSTFNSAVKYGESLVDPN
ncbi:MAG: sodium-independent anion transporter [Candidatus Cloacimonadota bacterium]|nr:MAG: sodium-independent anion transporter [Candidatus Cloacimonadota bacterium]PIE81641.1 MAG: sodium-independent anion transporter [Candidatus Delongbacteria bacterium]